MPSALFIVFCVVFSIEAFLICIGNAFTVYVFWKKRRTLQKASYLLINLALADLLVGVLEITILGTQVQPYLFIYSEQNGQMTSFHYSLFLSSLQVLFSCSSVFSLAVISLERVYAVVCPLQHRTVSSRVYFSSIAFIWAASVGAAALYTLSVNEVLSPTNTVAPINGTIVISLCVVCASYVIIRTRVKRTLLTFENECRRNMERNIKLSKTLFIVIGLSLICWIPATVTHTLVAFCQNCIPRVITLVTTILHVANSVVNPVVYCYRMAMFKEELKRCLANCRCNFPRHPRIDGIGQPEYFDTRL